MLTTSLEEKRRKKAAYQRQWRERNKEKVREFDKRTYGKNKAKRVQQAIAYKRANPDKAKAWAAGYRERHADQISYYTANNKDKQAVRSARRYELKKEDVRAYGKARYAKKKMEILSKNAEWRALNRDHVRKVQRKYVRRKRATVPSFLFIQTTRRRILNALAGVGSKSFRTTELLGCTGEEAVQYLEKLFKPGMSWENRREWHIDHIRPLASFDLTDPAQQKLAFHYKNLQPLWARENRQKAAKILR